MAKTAISAPQFTNEAAAVAHLEYSRWPHEVTCPHCGSDAVTRMGGKTQAGMFLCNDCREKFTCRTGTVMERSHIPVHKWLLAIYLMSSSKNGMSAHELHRLIGVTYKSAWFLAHRIREGMDVRNSGAMGGGPDDQVQMDETYYGNTSKRAKSYKRGMKHRASIVALVEPKTGRASAFHIKSANASAVQKLARTYIHRKSVLVTDDSAIYNKIGREFSDHQTVNHSREEYVNKSGYSTNNVENFFLQFKRGMRGTFIHCEEQHVQRYLNEFAFRYTNRSGVGVSDADRAARALKGIEGKRLTYRRPD